jgi:hypothetical protein
VVRNNQKVPEGYQAKTNLTSDPPKGSSIRWKQPAERTESILEDMKKVLTSQRESKEDMHKAKLKRKEIEHTANAKKAHYLVLVADMRDDEGNKLYGSDPKIAAKAEDLLTSDEEYQGCLERLKEKDEEIFTAKLDLEYLDGEWKILFAEAAMLAVK